MKKFTNTNLWVKTTNWEYWPWYIVYIPVFAYWLWLGLRARSIFFFSAANPCMRYGGILGGSKKEILDKVPKKYRPQTVLISQNTTLATVLQLMETIKLVFPIIMKPDIGERGYKVELIKNESEAAIYLQQATTDIIVQEFLDLPLEVGVFYYRLPNREKGVISSVVVKELLSVTGNGVSSLQELILAKPRAKLQLRRLKQVFDLELKRTPYLGEEIELEPIGNHNRGTAFLNGEYLITNQLGMVFDKISKEIEGFHYGRFDLRCNGVEALNNGDIKIMELNGAASEPAHIYSPKYPLRKGYQALFHHWNILFKISQQNHKRGHKYMTMRSGIEAWSKSRLA